MKLIVAYTPNLVFIDDFVYEIVKKYHKYIVAVLTTDGMKPKKAKFFKNIEKKISQLILVGLWESIKIQLKLYKRKYSNKHEILDFCEEHNIPTFHTKTINSVEAIDFLKSFEPDLIFNQANHILRKPVLDVPRIGVINIHGGRLPKYRGTLTPFWQTYNREQTRGIVFHLMDENLDSGPIIYQEEFQINHNDRFISLIKQKFSWAVDNLGIALEKLDREDWENALTPNDTSKADFFYFPRIWDVIKFKLKLY